MDEETGRWFSFAPPSGLGDTIAVKTLVTVEALVTASSVATLDAVGEFFTGFCVATVGGCAGTVWI